MYVYEGERRKERVRVCVKEKETEREIGREGVRIERVCICMRVFERKEE